MYSQKFVVNKYQIQKNHSTDYGSKICCENSAQMSLKFIPKTSIPSFNPTDIIDISYNIFSI